MESLMYQGITEFPEVSGKISWQSPSNIALTKYWGKHGVQLPRNPSISFTLKEARTETSLSFVPKIGDDINIEFYFEGEKNSGFRGRIVKYLTRHIEEFPYLTSYSWKIESGNTFPHSSGIASSASAMSALVSAFCDFEVSHLHSPEANRLKRASHLSRLASGSACRSVYPELAMWGCLEGWEDSSDLFAIPMQQILHPVFKGYHDDILIVSDEEKSVSSTAGHQLMEDNPFAPVRFNQARRHTGQIIDAIKSGDLSRFIAIVESEALTLHALMMSGQPSFMLMKPNTLNVIEEIRAFRSAENVPICFTLDAGPNVHILYPKSHAVICQKFIQDQLFPYAVDGRIIKDHLGPGASRL